MKGAGFFDLSQHDRFEMAAAGGEALEVEKPGIAKVAFGYFFWLFWFCSVCWGLDIRHTRDNSNLLLFLSYIFGRHGYIIKFTGSKNYGH